MTYDIPCTRLDLQCRKIHDLGAMNLAPSPTRGLWGQSIENIATHSPGAMKLGPIEYKDWMWGNVNAHVEQRASHFIKR